MKLKRIRFVLLMAVVVLPVLLVALEAPRPAAATAERQNGIAFTSWGQGLYGTPESARSLQQLRDTGANWISLLVTQYQWDLDTTTIYPTANTQTDAEVIATIREAHRLGLKVMLKPHVDLESWPGWRGYISFDNEADWTAWFASYRQFINHYAAIAEANNVEQFAVGTELRDTEHREAQWRQTIAGVRAIYSGPITYAANHGSEMGLTWWDAVDLIGVDAYYALADDNTPTREELVDGWYWHLYDLEDLYEEWNKPIIFTEVGYRSVNGAARQPWAWDIGGAVDLQEQVDLYEALRTVVDDKPWFGGLYVWDWNYDPFQGGVCDNGYTVYDKPAENVLRRWFGAAERSISTFPAVDESVTRVIYGDAPAAGWQNWSWSAVVKLDATDQVHSGTRSISVNATAWGALKLHLDAGVATAPYHFVEFYVRTDSASTDLYVRPYGAGDVELDWQDLADCRYTGNVPLAANSWTRVRVPLEHMGAADTTLHDIAIQVGDAGGKFWVDGLRLVGATDEDDGDGGGDGEPPLPITVVAAEDGYVIETQPTHSLGNAKVLRVKEARRDFRTYLKFNLSGLPAPVSKATLRLYVTDAGPDAGSVYVVGNGWTEASLTWRNAPAIGGVPVAGARPAAARRWVEWDVTEAIDGNGVYSLAIRNNSANVVGYVSSEGKQKPQLILEFAP